jgi:hypothetical protein
MSEPLHLEAPETPENKGENMFCPVTKELTAFYLGHSADGMEAYACGACKEPEPAVREVTQGALNAVFYQFHRDQ